MQDKTAKRSVYASRGTCTRKTSACLSLMSFPDDFEGIAYDCRASILTRNTKKQKHIVPPTTKACLPEHLTEGYLDDHTQSVNDVVDARLKRCKVNQPHWTLKLPTKKGIHHSLGLQLTHCLDCEGRTMKLRVFLRDKFRIAVLSAEA